jgi:hypothetical protein
MRGYHVMSGDGRKLGRAVGMHGDFLIVELGRLRRTRRPVPMVFVHPNDSKRIVTLTVPRSALRCSPKVNGTLDERAAAAHYGVAA